MYKLIRPFLFWFKDPETVHHFALYFLRLSALGPLNWLLNKVTKTDDPSLEQKLFGLKFKNPVGLAGGFDKYGQALLGLEALGFGFLETGTISMMPQPGNPRQRIFRLPNDNALINRMGFNNPGAKKLAWRFAHLKKFKIPIGISLGKSKITDLADAARDYLYSLEQLYPHGDYFALNVSSPNTPGLQQLQDKSHLVSMLSVLLGYRNEQPVKKPIFVKISPDLSLQAINEVVDVCNTFQVDGIIATNTTLSHEGLKTKTEELGGISGAPLREKATAIIRHIHRQAPSLPIIGVGGIFTAKDAYEKIKAGASLLQIYTGLVFEGPLIAKKINQGLIKLLKEDGFKNISEAVGKDT